MDTAAPNPPRGDYQKAENYIKKLVTLIESGKLEVVHTDLNKFDPSSIQDHYRMDLDNYQIEISHSKLPASGSDSYVMLFTNLKHVGEGTAEKAILAYTQLSNTQFNTFKTAAETQIEEKRRIEEEKRFNTALGPIDSLLEEVANKESLYSSPTSQIVEDKDPEIVKEESAVEMAEDNNAPLPSYSSVIAEATQEPKSEGLPKPSTDPYF